MKITWVGVPKEARKALRKNIRENHIGSEFMVCSEKGADQKARNLIRESLWAFNTDFILSHSRINPDESRAFAGSGYMDRVENALGKVQKELCEDANELIFALIKNFGRFVRDAIAADGRGHFMSSYDGREDEVEVAGKYYYTYRIN